jgi:hypothetical protein
MRTARLADAEAAMVQTSQLTLEFMEGRRSHSSRPSNSILFQRNLLCARVTFRPRTALMRFIRRSSAADFTGDLQQLAGIRDHRWTEHLTHICEESMRDHVNLLQAAVDFMPDAFVFVPLTLFPTC